jgi:ATP-dependent Clp protease ATP-binding subunit ClpC
MKCARLEATRLGSNAISPEHILLGIIGYESGMAMQALHDLGIDFTVLKTRILSQIGPGTTFPPEKLFPDADTQLVMNASVDISHEFLHNWVGTQHLLLGLIKVENTIPSRTLRQMGVDFQKARLSVLTNTPPSE